MSVRLDVTQAYTMTAGIRARAPKLRAEGRKILRRTGNAIEADAKANIVSLGAVDTGDMLGSTSTTMSGDNVEVGPTVNYGHYVELGVTDSATGDHPPRPYLAPAFDKNIGPCVAACAQAAARNF